MSKKSFQPSLSSEATTADIREDNEQAEKFQEIIDLLVAAGYFRAQISGLSNFDKIVGGLTWCIESCNFDVDVDLLFHENLTIGQKIALTEKIVIVLPKMNCPHRIEPHQIQGLDCRHILPIVQWLIIQSIKTREEMAEFVRAYSLSQWFKNNENTDATDHSDENQQDNCDIRRHYKRQGDPPADLEMQLKSTLLEYKSSPLHFKSVPKEEKICNDEDNHDDLMKTMSAVDDTLDRLSANAVGKIVNIQAQEIAKVAESFVNVQVTENQAPTSLERQKMNLQNKLDNICKEKQQLQNEITEVHEKLAKIRSDRAIVEDTFFRLKEMETNENKGMLRRLKELLSIHDGLKDQEIKFREQCKSDYENLQTILTGVEKDESRKEEQISAYNEQKEIVSKLKLQLAKKNRQVALMARQLDDIPRRSELTQYQKRFLELYNQVSAVHKETKQYYTLYNTLDDTKLYLNKELSILNSIQENYKEAMTSHSKQQEFLKQCKEIIDGISQNEAKVKKRFQDEEVKRCDLVQRLHKLKDQQHQYLLAVQDLSVQCSNNQELLLSLKLKEKRNERK